MRTPKECASVLAEIYDKAFGDKQSGGYRIDRDALRNITGRPIFHQTVIEDAADWLVERGLILIDRDHYFVIMRPAVLDGIREVPDDVLAAYHHPVSFGGPYDN
jgi:hypothetical protein